MQILNIPQCIGVPILGANINGVPAGLAATLSMRFSFLGPAPVQDVHLCTDVDAMFTLKVHPSDDPSRPYAISRHFSDFAQLRAELSIEDAAHGIDSLFPAKRWGGRVDDEQLEQWKGLLERWLNEALRRCQTSPPLAHFLDPNI